MVTMSGQWEAPRPLAIAPLNTPSSPHAEATPRSAGKESPLENTRWRRQSPSPPTATLPLTAHCSRVTSPSIVINQEGVCFESIFTNMSISISSILRIQKQFTRLQQDTRVGKESILEVEKKRKKNEQVMILKAEPDCHRLFSSHKQRQTPRFAGPFIILSPSIRRHMPTCLWPNDQPSSVRSHLFRDARVPADWLN